jgi:hypothetical protein
VSAEIAQGEKTWCPKCAHFQLTTNQTCEKCGASMARCWKPVSVTPAEKAALEAKQRKRDQRIYGAENPSLVCPHCQTKGKVRTSQIEVKAGISGGKDTAAVLTVGFSLLATGLSRKQKMTSAWCGECKSSWQF